MYSCTYCPNVALVNESRLVAVGGCTPAGCSGCNGIHISERRGSALGSAAPDATQNCSVGCVKTSSDGGQTWTKIRRFGGKPGMINYDREHRRVLLQYPDRYYAPNPGAVVQVTSPDGAHHHISCSHHATRRRPLTDGRWCRR